MNGKGYIQLYTGNGKGKTTAAFGLAVRAALAGKKVYIGQFIKDMQYHETGISSLVPGIDITQFGRGCFIDRNVDPIDADMARGGLESCREALSSGKYDVVILDELTIALRYGLLDVSDVLHALRQRSPRVEAVITGRYAPQELIDAADLVTEMVEIKHYYAKGVPARDGIER